MDSSYSDSIGEIEDQITPFEKIFRGQFIQIVQCRNCKFVSQSTQPFKDIIVDITSVNTVQKAVDLYFNTSDVKEYKCRECKVSATASQDMYIQDLPLVICVQLKRFTSTGKISKHIELNQILDMKPYLFQETSDVQVNYVVRALVKHIGSTKKSGHYTTVAEFNGHFLEYNDATVSQVLTKKDVEKNAYLIFLEKQSTVQAPNILATSKPTDPNETTSSCEYF